MKRSTIITLISKYLNQHCDPIFYDVSYRVMAEDILCQLEQVGFRPTEQDEILLKRHVIFYDREDNGNS